MLSALGLSAQLSSDLQFLRKPKSRSLLWNR